jgi:outer membrane protein OmpA-like peptidoglycan-associated protein
MKPSKTHYIIFMVLTMTILHGETFRFGLEKGDQYSIESTTVEDVYRDGAYLQSGRVTGKVSIEVLDSEGDNTHNRGDFFILEEISRGSEQVFELSEQITVEFERNTLGELVIDEKYTSPVMRNMPVFPEKDLAVGDTWIAMAEEVHDISRNYDVTEIRFPIEVHYTYLGPVEYEGKNLEHIELNYEVFYNNNPEYFTGYFYPARVRGLSERTLLWDSEIGMPYMMSEDFYIIFDLADGGEVVYEGVRSARYTKNKTLTDEEAGDVQKALSEIADTEVELKDEGITITLHNIHFDPDSPVLREEEKVRLKEIIEVLNYYSDKDLLITGHAADVGDWDKGVILSDQRAANTAAFIKEQLDNPDRLIMTKGVGAAEPIAPNTTEAGRRRNRRVEITILEN